MLSINDIFNEDYYLEINPEAAEAVANGDFASGLEHFQAVGIEEELRFSPFIDLDYYKRVANPDLNELTNRQALEHLLETGIEEGRLFSPFVDLEFYQEVNPTIANLSNSEALLHLRDIGLDRSWQFSPHVNLEEYRAFNPELSKLSLSEAFTNLGTFFAPDDEGRIRMPLAAGRFASGDTVNIVTPEMLAGSGEAIFTYSKSNNTVTMELNIDGLPFRPELTRSEDTSTPFNRQPVSVENGKWQAFIVSKALNFESTFWYDGQTGNLIGNEFDALDTPIVEDTPIDINGDEVIDTPVQFPSFQSSGFPLYEGNPDGKVDATFEFAYDQILDERGTAGLFAAFVPFNLNRPNEVGVYYTNGGLPVSEAANWDDVITTIRESRSFLLFTSLVSDPKPDFLASRDNIMLAHTSIYPNRIPKGNFLDFNTNTIRLVEAKDLTTNTSGPWPVRQAEIERETEQVFGGLESDELDAANPNNNFDGNWDTLFTGAGNDLVDASQATGPLFISTAGHNRMLGGTGLDELLAGKGDHLFGGVDNDILDAAAGSGSNRLYGGEGNDELFAGSQDSLFAGEGDDLLNASVGSGNNRLYGQDGLDTFFVGNGDRLLGGDGDDIFFVTDGGDNLITGGEGTDAFWIATGEIITSANVITDFEPDVDVIGVGGLGVATLDELGLSQVGDDAVISFSGFDLAILNNTQMSDLQTEGTFVFV